MIDTDKLIQFALDEYKIDSIEEELNHLRSTRCILRDELLTVYEYLKTKGLMDAYKEYRG